MNKPMNAAIALMAATTFLAGSVAVAQNGLAGELDDLLGYAEEVEVEAETVEPSEEAVEEIAEEEATELADEVVTEEDSQVADELAEIAEEAEAIADEEAVEELAADLTETTDDAASDAAEAAEETLAEVEETVEEADAVADAVDTGAEAAAEEVVEEVVDADAEAVAEAEEVVEETAEEAAEPVVAEVDEEVVEDEIVEDEIIEDEVAEAEEELLEDEADELIADEAEDEITDEADVEVTDAADDEVTDEVEEGSLADESTEEADQADAEVAEAEEPVDNSADIEEIAALERMRRIAINEHGKASYNNGRRELEDGNYTEAIKQFDEALRFLINKDENRALREGAQKSLAEAKYRLAERYFKNGDYDNAIVFANQAREDGHKKASDLVGRIQKAKDAPPEIKVETAGARWDSREYKKNREEIKAHMRAARQYYITGELDKAREELEIILRDNPYEQDAINMLRRVASKGYDVESSEFKTTRQSMIEQVREKWTPNQYAINVPDLGSDDEGATVKGTKVSVAGLTVEEETTEKMKKIIIPEIAFKSASINDVVDFFIEMSREYDDPDIPPEQRGVNLILKVAAAAAEETLDDGNLFETQATSNNGIAPITFSARYMSLYDGLQYACELSKLKFRIRGTTVMIMPENEADVDMVSRTYTVLPSIEERAASMSTSSSSSSSDEEGGSFFSEDSSSDVASSGGTDWKQLFEDMGVKWPNGSSIKYLPSINKMRVLNTPENLIEFEKALQELNVTPRQVEIEARFVEVAQTDLESLGFEWLLTDSWEIAKNKNNPQQYIQVAKGAGTANANRYLTGATASDGSSTIPFAGLSAVNDAILKVNSVLTNPELGFVLHMLSQQANTDLLSSPKVVTMTGQEAKIKVVREYIYPTEYEIKENDSGDSDSDNVQISYPSVEPQEFETRDVGVILTVVPQVSDDGQMISLYLNPQIIDEPEWKDYGFDYPIMGQSEPYHIKMEQPIFKLRSVEANIAIYNGATVVMGGMITEQRREVNDKIPFLGDIPLIGRLFRSQYEHSEKRNLLIFVTARMVDPAGRTLKTNVSDAPVASVDE